jgi:large repetitive protein
MALAAAALVVAPFTAPAAIASPPSPTIGLTRTVAAQTLLGSAVAVTLTATNADTVDGYNLSYTDVLASGIPVADVSPAPSSSFLESDGSHLLFWSNESDLLHGTTATFSYSYTYPASFDAGKVLAGNATAYVNTDERQVPQFAAATGVVSNSTGSAGPIASSTTLVPFTVTKTDPNAEGELLRGVHDHKTPYTITITNNSVRATTGYSITDYLPAGLEFLGCTNTDNSAAVPAEYSGSGDITNGGFPATLTNCTDGTLTATTIAVTAASPVTLADAADGTSGALPNGIYTEVTWTGLGTLAAGASLTLQYAAAVPMRENVMPTGTGFNPIANLDNNTGALTTDEQPLTNWADVSGVYEGNTVHVSGYDTVTAEDVAIQKSFAPGQGTVAQQSITNWTLHVESSEYATQTGAITVTDTIPDGQAYTATQGPAGLPNPTVTTNADGTQTVVWTLPGFAAKDGDTSILYTTTTLVNYRVKFGGGRVSAGDSLTNTVHADAAGVVLRNNNDDGGSSVAAAVNVLDDSQATQTSTTVSITKEVAEPPAATTNTDCALDSGLAWTSTTTGHYNVGDTVCWRLTVPFLDSVDTLNATISDLLPAGYTYVSWAKTAANTVSFSADPTTAAPAIKWVISDAVQASPVKTFQVILTTVISDPTAVTNGQLTQNLAKLRWQSSAGAAFQSRDLASTTVDKPILGIAKTASTPTASAGTSVGFTVTLTNTGGQDATATKVTDVLPNGWGCANITTATITNGGTCDTTTNIITWTGLTVPAAGTLALTYSGVAPVGISSADVFKNTATVVSYMGATNTGGAVLYTPSPALTASATVTVPSPTVTKVTDHPTAAIGDTVTWTITSSVLANTTLYGSPNLSDVVPSGYAVTSASLLVGGVAGPATTVSGNTVTAPLVTSPTTSISGGGSAIPLSLTIVAVLKNVSTTLRTNSIPNTAKLNWTGEFPAIAHSVSSTPIATVVAEPDITIAKTDSLNHTVPIIPGGNVTYTLAVGNGKTGDLDLSTGHSTTVVDTVPADITPLNAVGGAPLTADGTVQGTGGTGAWSEAPRTITWNIGDVAAHATTTLTYDARIANPLVGNDVADLTNTAVVSTDSQVDSTNPNDRSGSPSGIAGYYATTSDTLPNPPISVAKSAPAIATIGDEVPYSVTVTVPAFTVAYDSFATDTLPADVQFDTSAGITVTCSEGGAATCADALPAALIPGTTSSSTSFGVWFGDIAAAPQARVVTITYNGIVRLPSSPVTYRGNTMTNAIQYFSNTAAHGQASPGNYPSTTGMVSSNKATAATTEVEPLLTITKAVTGTEAFAATPPRAKPGSTLTYTVTEKNTGTSTAYDAVVNDLLPKDITCESVTSISGTGYTCLDTPASTTSGGTVTWTLASLAAGASVTETYTVSVPTDANLTQSLEKNTADIPVYYGLDAATRASTTNSYQTYNAASGYDPSANASVTVDRASLAGTFSLDLDANGAFSAGDLDIAGVKVKATLLGAGGVPTGETYEVTTAADGSYLFTDLPAGTWVVAPASDDTVLSALGVTPSWDADAATLGTVTSVLADAQQLTGRDLGYKAAGSIGDTVWLDQNRDGIQNLTAGDTEPGIPGVTVTLHRAAGGGVPALTLTTTTSATGTVGRYGFANLPTGSYTVTETTPSGYTTEWDPDTHFTAPDGSTSHTLGVAEHDTSEDFGLVGAQGFSGTIWLDRNSDATNDNGEPGIPGATVTLTTTDGASLTTTTDSLGHYSFGNLPPGSYTVTPSAGLPAGATETYDYDGIAAPKPANQAVVTLAAATAGPTDVDFGYNALQSLGGTVFWNFNGNNTAAVDPRIPGATVTVTYFGADGVPGGGDDIVYTATTAADGTWSLPNVSEGKYKVVVSGTPAGFAANWDTDTPNADGLGTTLVTVGATPAPAQDFGYAGTGSIGTTVYLDRDSNGVQAPTGEPGIGGVNVTLTYHNPQDTSGASDLVLTTTTASDGAYSFPGLPDANSDYTVSIVVPTGYTAVSSLAPVGPATDHTTTTVTLTPALPTIADANFGLLGDGELGDTVYLDENGDGVQQSTDPGIPGATVTLTWYGPDGVVGGGDDLSYARITTAADGTWDESGLPTGTYSVVVSGVPAGLTNTADPDGGTPSASVVTIGGLASLVNLNQDFGYQGSASVGDTIWLDVNGDGTQQSGDPGLSGIPVTVTSAGTDGVLGTADDVSVTTTTDSAGHYTVTGLPAGATSVSYATGSLPAGDVAHSDLDGADPSVTTLTLATGDNRTDVDFVATGSQQLSGVVFNDKNGNRKQDAGETGVAGITVTVTWAGPNGPVTISTVTGPGGAWSLTGIPAGSYTVSADPSTYPPKFHSSIGQNTSLALPAGGSMIVVTGITTVLLAYTGSDVTGMFTVAILLLLVGLGIVLLRRRRTA